MLNIKSTIVKNFYFNNYYTINNKVFGNKFIHNSSILYSRATDHVIINLNNEKLSQLQLIKYEKEAVDEDIKDLGGSSFAECFPFLTDNKGNFIEFHKPINLFNGVNLISEFIEKKFDVEKDNISEVKISQLLDLYKNNKEVTVLELFNHVGKIFDEDKNKILSSAQASSTEVSRIPENENNLSAWSLDNLNTNKPLGLTGDITINELIVKMKDLKWDMIYNNAKISIHALPIVTSFFTYGFVLKSYVKYVHNRPYNPHLVLLERKNQEILRNKQLALFIVIGAPLTVMFMRTTAIELKNMINIDIGVNNTTEFDRENNNSTAQAINNSFLLVLSKLNKKIPDWLKLFFKLFFLGILVLKLLGFSIISDVMVNIDILKNIVYIICFFSISYQLLNLYFLYKFSNKSLKISNVLPNFIINWLKLIESLSSSKYAIEGACAAKKNCYIEISLYIAIVVIVTLIT